MMTRRERLNAIFAGPVPGRSEFIGRGVRSWALNLRRICRRLRLPDPDALAAWQRGGRVYSMALERNDIACWQRHYNSKTVVGVMPNRGV
jgi:hypothetical protein